MQSDFTNRISSAPPFESATTQGASFGIAIMAAGKGTRLKSRYPKVVHCVGGKPLLQHVIDAALQIVPAKDVYAIVGHEADLVKQTVAASGINFILQAEQLGTGHAMMVARSALEGYDFFLVLSGDVPLIRPSTIAAVRTFHREHGAAMTILTAEPSDPTGYGRILRKSNIGGLSAEVSSIVEQKDLCPGQEQLREINSGIYAFSSRPLFAHLDKLARNNAQQEYYLTDMASLLVRAGEKVVGVKAQDASEVLGANTRAELSTLDAGLRQRKCAELMAEGVTIFRPDTCVIDANVKVAPDTIIEPFVQLLGRTEIGSECQISSYTVIRDSHIGDRVTVRPGCVFTEAKVRDGAQLGPFSHLRPAADVGPGAHVGNFVELKKTTLGKGSKANHLTYLGDAVIGEGVNVGAGTITCNYDGVHKYQTKIEDGAFIGSDTTLVAPVTVGKRAYVGASSCVTEDVPPESLALGRARQVNKVGWARRPAETAPNNSSS